MSFRVEEAKKWFYCVIEREENGYHILIIYITKVFAVYLNFVMIPLNI
jgi:hypothetical protein